MAIMTERSKDVKDHGNGRFPHSGPEPYREGVHGDAKDDDLGPDPEPEEPGKPLLPLLYFRDIGPCLEAADFVEDLLIDEGLSVTYGEAGCGKTFFILHLGLHVAAGLRWFDREVERGGVLYLALEGSYGIRNRIAAFK